VVSCKSRKNCVDPCKTVLLLLNLYYSNNLGDYDYSPLCEFKPVCRDKPNGNYVDQYRPNCQFHYTCLESRTFNYTACEYGHRFSVQHQKCLPANKVKCLGIVLFHDYLSLQILLIYILFKFNF
jgi:hypothetical protein